VAVFTGYIPTNTTSEKIYRYFVCDIEADRPVTGLVEGDLAYTRDSNKLWTAASATTWQAVIGSSGTLFTQTATVTDSNNAAEVTLTGAGTGSLTLPVNFLTAGRTLRITAAGTVGTQAVPVTLNMRLKLGGTTILSTGDQTPGASVTARAWSIQAVITCRTTGATGTVFGQSQGGFLHMETAGATGTPTEWEMTATATSTVDTTGTLAVDLTADWAAGVAAADTISCTNLILEALN